MRPSKTIIHNNDLWVSKEDLQKVLILNTCLKQVLD